MARQGGLRWSAGAAQPALLDAAARAGPAPSSAGSPGFHPRPIAPRACTVGHAEGYLRRLRQHLCGPCRGAAGQARRAARPIPARCGFRPPRMASRASPRSMPPCARRRAGRLGRSGASLTALASGRAGAPSAQREGRLRSLNDRADGATGASSFLRAQP